MYVYDFSLLLCVYTLQFTLLSLYTLSTEQYTIYVARSNVVNTIYVQYTSEFDNSYIDSVLLDAVVAAAVAIVSIRFV